MDIIHLGQGLRWQHWLTVVKRQPRAQTSAIVTDEGDSTGSSEIFEGDTAIPVYDSLQTALAEVPADLAIVTGRDSLQFAAEAFDAGLWVILDELGVIDADAVRKLIALSQSCQRPLLVPRRYGYAACENMVRRLLGMLGPIGHVSCIDSHALPNGGDADRYPQAQLSLAGVGHFNSLARLFDSGIASVMARVVPDAVGEPGTEAFLELDAGRLTDRLVEPRDDPRVVAGGQPLEDR